MRFIYLTLSGLFMSGIVLAGCRREPSDITLSSSLMQSDSIPSEIKTLAQVMADNDSVGFSQIVSYPLQRPYPLKDVKDREEMKKYYSVLVDDSLRRKLAMSAPADWSESGWRGWTIDDGRYIWVDDSVYDVSYLSGKEKALLADLIERERATLPEDLREGWLPEWCMEDPDDGTVYRIDVESTSSNADISNGEGMVFYRLAVYDKGNDLRHRPKRIFRGRKRVEGTMGELTYYFDSIRPDSADENSEIVISPYSSDSHNPRVYSKRDTSNRELRKAYWLDLVKYRKK